MITRHKSLTGSNIQIQRHGARFPTTGAAARIQAALEKLQSADEFLNPKMKFLADYVYSLGQNDLLQYGAAECVRSLCVALRFLISILDQSRQEKRRMIAIRSSFLKTISHLSEHRFRLAWWILPLTGLQVSVSAPSYRSPPSSSIH